MRLCELCRLKALTRGRTNHFSNILADRNITQLMLLNCSLKFRSASPYNMFMILAAPVDHQSSSSVSSHDREWTSIPNIYVKGHFVEVLLHGHRMTDTHNGPIAVSGRLTWSRLTDAIKNWPFDWLVDSLSYVLNQVTPVQGLLFAAHCINARSDFCRQAVFSLQVARSWLRPIADADRCDKGAGPLSVSSH